MSQFKMRLLSVFVVLSLFISINVMAGLRGYSERFILVKNEQGEVTAIKDRSLTYRRHLKEEVWASYDLWMKRLAQYKNVPNPTDQELSSDFSAISKLTEDQIDFPEKLNNLMARLQRTWGDQESIPELNEIKEKINPILNQLEKDIEKEMTLPSWQVVASLNHPGYFYKRNVFREIIRQAASQIKLIVPVGPAVTWVIYFVKMYESYLHETKREHQSMLLYYLRTYHGEDLGLTEVEQARAISSVFESDISFYNIFEHFKARKTWDTYGLLKLEKVKEKFEARKHKYQDYFSGPVIDLTPFHSEARKDSGQVLIDFYTKKSIVEGRYSLSYYYQRPKLVLAKRIYFTIVRFIYGVLPLPPGAGTILDIYTGSKMDSQIRREGSLVAKFEASNNRDMVKKLIIQAVNPVAYGFEHAFGLLKTGQ